MTVESDLRLLPLELVTSSVGRSLRQCAWQSLRSEISYIVQRMVDLQVSNTEEDSNLQSALFNYSFDLHVCTSLTAFTSAPLFINISAHRSPSLVLAAICRGVSPAYSSVIIGIFNKEKHSLIIKLYITMEILKFTFPPLNSTCAP